MANQPKHPTAVRVRLDPELRTAAQDRAIDEGTHLTTLVRQWITCYAATGSPVASSESNAQRRTGT